MVASLKRELGALERVTAWLRVFGMVNAAPGFDRSPLVIKGCSALIIELFRKERGGHALRDWRGGAAVQCAGRDRGGGRDRGLRAVPGRAPARDLWRSP